MITNLHGKNFAYEENKKSTKFTIFQIQFLSRKLNIPSTMKMIFLLVLIGMTAQGAKLTEETEAKLDAQGQKAGKFKAHFKIKCYVMYININF